MKLDIWLDSDEEILTATINVIENKGEYVVYRETYPNGGYHKAWFDGFVRLEDAQAELRELCDMAIHLGFHAVVTI
jgi:hypothetical protein